MAASKSGKAGAADFDMTKFFDFEKMMGDMRVPGFDATSLM